MLDQITTLGKSRVQHGKYNDRIYLMKLHEDDLETILPQLFNLAQEHKYSKIFCKVPQWAAEYFEKKQFVKEAEIPHFYQGKTSACFYSRFIDNDRETVSDEDKKEIQKNVKLAKEKQSDSKNKMALDSEINKINEDQTEQLAAFYRQVFASYPFPIYEADYLLQTMRTHVDYFGICKEGHFAAVSSAEKDSDAQNAEMTDFATLPGYRCHGYAGKLLAGMETKMLNENIRCLYTIARAHSAGINILFAKQGYQFGGTLINNTHISGRIESMHVWYKIVD